MPRRPKGSVIRFDPDWDPFRMMYANDFVTLASATPVQDIGLYNNATDGSMLVVWDASLMIATAPGVIPGTSTINWGVAAQKPVTNPTAGFPLIPNAPTGPGIVWENHNSPGVNNVPFICVEDPDHWEWPHSWPMCYIPPGYSLVVEFVSSLTSGSCPCNGCFMWQWGVKIP